MMMKKLNVLFVNSTKCVMRGRWLSLFANNNESSFESYLNAKIKMKGPLTVAEFMKEALGNPKWGYYMNKDVFGAKGDFITSPEVSQMFGEMIGVWFLNEWLILNQLYGKHMPKTVQMIELGPGRGTLMNDLLRTWTRQKETSNLTLDVIMVENSDFMRRMQFKKLTAQDNDNNDNEKEPKLYETYKSKHSEKSTITWINDINELPRKEAVHFFLANEFFDALPIHKFQKTPNGYREVVVDYDEKEKKFKFVLSHKLTIGSQVILKLNPNYSNFDHIEISPESGRYMEAIANRLSDYNGSALFIDYGHNGVCSDTLRAFKEHKQVDVLKEPGKVDLTVDVDFAFLKHIAQKSNVVCYGPVNQGDFLSQMQIGTRLQMLLKTCKTENERTKLVQSFNTLIKADQMGERFKLMALRKFDFKQSPPGFFNNVVSEQQQNDKK